MTTTGTGHLPPTHTTWRQLQLIIYDPINTARCVPWSHARCKRSPSRLVSHPRMVEIPAGETAPGGAKGKQSKCSSVRFSFTHDKTRENPFGLTWLRYEYSAYSAYRGKQGTATKGRFQHRLLLGSVRWRYIFLQLGAFILRIFRSYHPQLFAIKSNQIKEDVPRYNDHVDGMLISKLSFCFGTDCGLPAYINTRFKIGNTPLFWFLSSASSLQQCKEMHDASAAWQCDHDSTAARALTRSIRSTNPPQSIRTFGLNMDNSNGPIILGNKSATVILRSRRSKHVIVLVSIK